MEGCDKQIDDICFLRELVRYIQDERSKDQNFAIDLERIYSTGMSNGGIMTNRIGRKMSDIVAAIVPVAGPLMNEARFKRFHLRDFFKNPILILFTSSAAFIWGSDPFECKPERPMPVLQFHHVDDKNVPFKGTPIDRLSFGRFFHSEMAYFERCG